MSPALKPLKWYKALSTRKGRLAAGAFLVEGEKAVGQVITGHPGEIQEILIAGEIPSEYKDFSIRSLTESQFRYISTNRTPQNIAAVVKSPPDVYSDTLPADTGSRILLLEDIQDPGNAGTLIRTAAAFGYTGVIMTDNCADPLSPKCVQSTAGSILSLWIRRTPRYTGLIRELRGKGYVRIAADLGGTVNPSILTGQSRLILALGNEASGLSGEVLGESDYRVSIPIVRENIESLNVAVCGAICMYLSSK